MVKQAEAVVESTGFSRPIPEVALKNLRDQALQIRIAQQALEAYAKGVLAGMGLEGTWAVNIEQGQFVSENSA